MKQLTALFLSTLALIITTNVRAQDNTTIAETSIEPEATYSGLQLKPSLTFQFMNPRELNNALKSFKPFGEELPGKISGAAGFTLEAGYAVNRNLSLGGRLEYFNSSLTRTASMNGGSYRDETTLSGLIPYVTVAAQTEALPRFMLGLIGGLGTPLFYHLDHEAELNAGSTSKKGSATFAASPVAGFTAVTMGYEVSRHVMIGTEIGYKLLNASSMNATEDGKDDLASIRKGDSFRSGGNTVRVNSNGPYINLGVTVTL